MSVGAVAEVDVEMIEVVDTEVVEVVEVEGTVVWLPVCLCYMASWKVRLKAMV